MKCPSCECDSMVSLQKMCKCLSCSFINDYNALQTYWDVKDAIPESKEPKEGEWWYVNLDGHDSLIEMEIVKITDKTIYLRSQQRHRYVKPGPSGTYKKDAIELVEEIKK